MELVVEHPHMPYIGPVPNKSFTPGKWLKVRGVIPGRGCRFNIRLQCTAEIIIQNDIALQFSVTIQNNTISLNSKQSGKWDDVQTIIGIPFKYEERFELAILCDFTNYKISLNGDLYCEFPQRITYDRISHLVIDGDVSVEQISYETSTSEVLLAPLSFKYDEAPPPYNEVESKKNSIYTINYASTPLPTSNVPPYSTTALPRYSPYSVQPEIYPATLDTTMSLNDASSSNSQLVPSSNNKKCSTYVCFLILLSVLIAACMLAKAKL